MTNTDLAPDVVYSELSATDLAKLINDEYSQVLWAERSNLPRAKAIGEKLVALRAGTVHGEWQTKLKKWCPKLSYETATRYTKIYEKWPEIEKAAATKSVKTADLTIDAALKLLAKPPANGNANKVGNAGKAGGAVDPPDTKKVEDVGKEWLRALAVDDLITWLKEIHRTDTAYLQELSAALGKVLRPQSSVLIGSGGTENVTH